jgi:hypothetical protein
MGKARAKVTRGDMCRYPTGFLSHCGPAEQKSTTMFFGHVPIDCSAAAGSTESQPSLDNELVLIIRIRSTALPLVMCSDTALPTTGKRMAAAWRPSQKLSGIHQSRRHGTSTEQRALPTVGAIIAKQSQRSFTHHQIAKAGIHEENPNDSSIRRYDGDRYAG